MDGRLTARQVADEFGDVQHGQLDGVADVCRSCAVGSGERDQCVDGVIDVAQRAGLLTAAGHRDRLAGQRLTAEGGHHATVIGAHPWAVRVEDARHPDVGGPHPTIRKRQRFGEALRLVVNTARTDRIDVSPIGLRLRMLQWVSVHLAGGGQHHPGAAPLGNVEDVGCAKRSGAQGLHRQAQVVDG